MKIEINKEEVLKYFNDLINDDKTWKGDYESNQTTANMINGALVFANIFGLITEEEKINLIFGEGDN